ncbi:MAG TPA: HlyD family efflux transporter periplasmic adaptor subunit [Steroidobacteraceae bacterium]|nr:HlyD family efflux transporter periplasmic adaptor subunit [Steroidobacteraceae bacterium]HRX90512.1 HlyD family efflux transporter periplasmic adaptor subunit [Steroidobacteraceae bacterium]
MPRGEARFAQQLCLLALLAAATGGSPAGDRIELTPAQRANARIETIAVDASSAQAASGLTVTGRVEAGAEGRALLTAPATGRVVQLNALPGRTVKRGDVLLVLAGPEIATLQGSAREAQATTKAAEQRVTRDRMLLKEGVIASSRLEQSEAEFAAASAQRSVVIGANPGMDLTTRDGQMIVRSPIDGVLAGPRLAIGQNIAMGDSLAVLGTPQRLRVALAASAEVARQLNPGDAVTVRGRSCEATAVLRSVGTQVEANHVVTVDAMITDADTCLLPGESVTASIAPQTAAAGSFALPPRAFVRRGPETFVFVERAGGFEVVLVDPDAARAGFARSDSLNSGDRVAITGTALLKGAWLGIADEE